MAEEALGTGGVRAAGGRSGLVQVAGDGGEQAGSEGNGWAPRGAGDGDCGAGLGPRGARGRARRGGIVPVAAARLGVLEGPSPCAASSFSSVASHREPGPLLLSHILSRGRFQAEDARRRLLGSLCWWKHWIWCNSELGQHLPLPGEHHRAPEGLGDGRTPMPVGCCHSTLREQTGSFRGPCQSDDGTELWLQLKLYFLHGILLLG